MQAVQLREVLTEKHSDGEILVNVGEATFTVAGIELVGNAAQGKVDVVLKVDKKLDVVVGSTVPLENPDQGKLPLEGNGDSSNGNAQAGTENGSGDGKSENGSKPDAASQGDVAPVSVPPTVPGNESNSQGDDQSSDDNDSPKE